MTDLKKMISRRSVDQVPAIRRRLVVALMPGDVIAFREEGRRKWYSAPLGKVFIQVAKWNADAEVAEKKRLRAERKRPR
jgi:hypothetical protein